MPNVSFVQRETPVVTTPVDEPGWNWEKVNAKLERRGPITFFVTLFRPWMTVTAPKGTRCAVMNLRGEPLYRFKAWRGKTYCLEMEPSPGFPGS